MTHRTPSKKFISDVKDQLADIASMGKKNPHFGSPACFNSLKRMEKMVSRSGIKQTDKQEINFQLESIERSLSSKKRRRVSSTEERSDKTHKKPGSILKARKEKLSSSRRKETASYEMRELQLRNRMLEEQVKSYKVKVRQARRLMIAELRQDEEVADLDYVEFDQTKKEVRDAKKEVRALLRENEKLKEALRERDERIAEQEQQNNKLKQRLKEGRNKSKEQGELESVREDEISRLKSQIKRLKIEKKAGDKKEALLSNNEKLREIVKRYKSYL